MIFGIFKICFDFVFFFWSRLFFPLKNIISHGFWCVLACNGVMWRRERERESEREREKERERKRERDRERKRERESVGQ